MSRNSLKKFNSRLKELVEKGYYKTNKGYVLSSNYVFRILDEDDELHTPENIERIKHSRIMINKEGDYYVLKRELVKIGLNPTDRKFFDLNNLSNNL